MVRETRHLWVGNLPDNIREERILEHFKRYGRVQSVKLLPRGCSYGHSGASNQQQQHNNHLQLNQHNNNSNNSNTSSSAASSATNLASSGKIVPSHSNTTTTCPTVNTSPSANSSSSAMSPWPSTTSAVTGAAAPSPVTTCCCTVAFMDIKSAAKALAHTADHNLDDRTLTTEYYEPAALHHKQQQQFADKGGGPPEKIVAEKGGERAVERFMMMMTPSSRDAVIGEREREVGSGGSTPTSSYSTSPGGVQPGVVGGGRFPNGHSTAEDLHPFGLTVTNSTSTPPTPSSGTPDRYLHSSVRRPYNHHTGSLGGNNSQRHRDRLGSGGGIMPTGGTQTSSAYHSHRTNGPSIGSVVVGGIPYERVDIRQRLGGSWNSGGGYDIGGLTCGGSVSSRYESGTVYSTSPSTPTTPTPLPTVPSSITTPLDTCGTGTGGSINKSTSKTKSKTSAQEQQRHKSRSRSNSVSGGSASSRSASRSRSSSSSSSSSSSEEGGGGTVVNNTGSTLYSAISPKSRRPSTLSSGSGGNSGSGGAQPTSNSSSSTSSIVVHSDDRRPLAICVRNLPLRSSDTSLKDGLFHEYKKHGKVTWVKVVGSGSERHAIVCFKKPEDVEKALEVSYDKLFFGCKIEVAPYQGYDVDDNDLRPYEAEIDEFHPKATRTLFIGNLEKDLTATDLRSHFEQFGSIIEIDIKKQGIGNSYAFCQYSDIVSVVRAIRTMDGEHLGNNRVKLGFGKSMLTNCVWIDGVGDAVGEKYLRLQFNPFGVINQVYIDRDRGQSLIFYEAVVSAQTAVTKMRGHNLRGKKIQVDFASRECQDTFFDHLEKQGFPLDRPAAERCNVDSETSGRLEVVSCGSVGGAVSGTTVGGVVDRRGNVRNVGSGGGFIGTTGGEVRLCSTRFERYDTVTGRPRTASYSGRSAPPPSPGGSIPLPQSPSSTAGGIVAGASHRGTPSSRSGGSRLGGSSGTDRRYSSISSDTYSSASSNLIYSPPNLPSTPTDSYSYHQPSGNTTCYSPPSQTAHHLMDHSGHYHNSPPSSSIISQESHGIIDHHMMHMVQFAQPDNMRNLQKERVHLLEQLEECPSSGDEVLSPKKRMKMEHADGSITSEVVMVEVGGNGRGDHRKIMEIRRLSDASSATITGSTLSSNTPNKHGAPLTTRRLSTTSNPSNQPSTPTNSSSVSASYLPHTICKRRKTTSSDNGAGSGSGNTPQRQHSHSNNNSNYDGVESGSSRPGTPLCDERPESAPSEPRRTGGVVGTRAERDDKPMVLPLPKFALVLMGRGNYSSVSIGGVKGQKDSQVLSGSPPAVTSPRYNKLPVPTTPSTPTTPISAATPTVVTPQTNLLTHVPPPASPPPRPPSLGASSTSSCGGDSDSGLAGGSGAIATVAPGGGGTAAGGEQSLDERIRSLDERYEKWSGSRAISAAGGDVLGLGGGGVGGKLDSTRERFKIRHKLLDLDLKEVQPSEIVKSVMAKRSVFDEDSKRLENVGEKYEPRDFTVAFSNNPPNHSSTATPTVVQSTSVPANNNNSNNSIVIAATPLANVTHATVAVATPSQQPLEPQSVVATPAKGLQYPFPSHPPAPTSLNNVVVTSNTNTAASAVRNPPSHGVVVVDNRLKSCANVSTPNSSDSRTQTVNPSSKIAPPPSRTSVTKPNETSANKDETLKQTIKVRRNSSTATCDASANISATTPTNQHCKSRRNSTSENSDNCDNSEKDRLAREVQEQQRVETDQLEKERLDKEREVERERIEKEKDRVFEKERVERERLEKEHRKQFEREKKEREEREKREKEEQVKREREEKERREREEKEKERKEREKEEQHRLEQQQLEKERQEKAELRRKEKQEREREDNQHEKQRQISKELRVAENQKDEIKLNSTFKEARENHKSTHTHDKSKSHGERKDSVKENRENNIYDKSKHLFNNEISEVKDRPPTLGESHHISIEFDKKEPSKHSDPNRRKERNNSLPATIGMKRRISEISDSVDESKKMKLYSEQQHKKLGERRDSKDSSKDEKVKLKHKNNSSSKSFDEKVKHNHVKDKDRDKEKEREERHRNKHLQRLEKHKKSKSRDKDSPTESSQLQSHYQQSSQLQIKLPKDTSTIMQQATTTTDKDFLSKLDLIEVESQKHAKKEFKEKRRHETTSEEEQHKPDRKDKHALMLADHRTKDELTKSFEERKLKNRIRKLTADSSADNNSDSDEPKKRSIFDIVDDEPAYISMYDKVKARSCKNMQKQEEEKKQEKIKAKFNQLKQSRAKREEKKRSTSWDEDSDSDTMRSRKLKPIASSDEECDHSKTKPKHAYSDSDSDRMRQIKSEPPDSSDEEQFKSTNRKSSKSRIASDSSDDDFKNIKNQLKIEMLSDNDDQSFVDLDEKYSTKSMIKEEFTDNTMFTKDKKPIIKTQESFMDLNAQIFGDSNSPILELKQEKINNTSRVYGDISSADECKEKQESRRKHKKKQKRQKSSISSEEGSKLDSLVDNNHGGETTSDKKNSEKRKHVSKKDKKRDKTKDEDKKEKSRSKSKRSRSENKDSFNKRDGKMENIFGSLSDDSEDIMKDSSVHVPAIVEQLDKLVEVTETSITYGSDSDNLTTDALQLETKERSFKDEHRKRKDKKRRDKEKQFLREETTTAAVAIVNENSIDFADLGKQLEDNIKDHSNENLIHDDDKIDVDETAHDSMSQDRFKFTETDLKDVESKSKDGKVKKKKRKKSKDEKHRHHHHHHDKNKVLKSPEVRETKKEFTPPEESMPNILDIASPPQAKTILDNSIISPQSEEALLSPLAAILTSSKDKKRDKFLPEFDEIVRENAVKSISEFGPAKSETPVPKMPASEIIESETKDEKRVVISQEETEDAVAALLGESFCSTSQFEDYAVEETPGVGEQTANTAAAAAAAAATEEENVQDDEEMRQAVQSLKSPELELKPDTPQSENDLQIDTDTEEQDESLRFDQPPRTPDMLELSQPPKTPDIPSYFPKEEETPKTAAPIVKTIPSTINIGSPPSLTPIKPSNIPSITVETVKKILDKTADNKCPSSVPLLPTQKPPLTVITTKTWSESTSSAQDQTKVQPIIVTTVKPNYDKVPPLAIQTSAVVCLMGQNKIVTKPDCVDAAQKIISLHNMPQQMPSYPVSKAQELLSPKAVANSNRLPITPVMITKPIQLQTVIVPQAKVADIRPPLVYHTAANMPRFSTAAYSPVNVRTQQNPVQRLPAPTTQQAVQPQRATLTTQSVVRQPISISTTCAPPLKVIEKQSPAMLPTSVPQQFLPVPPLVQSTSCTKPFTPVIQEAPKLFNIIATDKPTQSTIIQSTTILHTQNTELRLEEVKSESLQVHKTVFHTVSPGPVIQVASATKNLIPIIAKAEEKKDNDSLSTSKVISAVEKVMDELNLMLKKTEEPSNIFKAGELKPNVDDDSSKASRQGDILQQVAPIAEIKIIKEEELSDPKDSFILEDTDPLATDKVVPLAVIKEIEKFNDDIDNKTETESVLSDSSKERLSADTVKDDAIDSKEDSDYWSAKEVNIDSVIKKVDALCSADNLSDRSSDVGKDDWPEDGQIKLDDDFSKLSEKDLYSCDEGVDNDDREILTRSGRGRGTRQRGRKSTRGGNTAKRGGKVIATSAKDLAPPARRGGRGSRPRNDRKVSKSESDDVYEFRDDSDDTGVNKDRPRLILTIKSPAVNSTNGGQAQVKEVIANKELLISSLSSTVPATMACTTIVANTSEEFASPVANTRKSRRLQERDGSRNTVDDTIEDVVKNKVTQTGPATTTRRSARQNTTLAPTNLTSSINSPLSSIKVTKSLRVGRKSKDRRASDTTTTDDSSEEKSVKSESAMSPATPESSLPILEPIQKTAEAPPEVNKEIVKEKPHEGLKAAVLRRVKNDMSQEPQTLIDPVTGLLMEMRECEENRYIPVADKPKETIVATGTVTVISTTTITRLVSTTTTSTATTTPVASASTTPSASLVTISSVIPIALTTTTPTTVVQTQVRQAQSLKAHVLNSQNQIQTTPQVSVATKPTVTPATATIALNPSAITALQTSSNKLVQQQQQQQQQSALVLQQPPSVKPNVGAIVPSTPITQALNVAVTGPYEASNLSPRLTVKQAKPIALVQAQQTVKVIQSPLSPMSPITINQQQQQQQLQQQQLLQEQQHQVQVQQIQQQQVAIAIATKLAQSQQQNVGVGQTKNVTSLQHQIHAQQQQQQVLSAIKLQQQQVLSAANVVKQQAMHALKVQQQQQQLQAMKHHPPQPTLGQLKQQPPSVQPPPVSHLPTNLGQHQQHATNKQPHPAHMLSVQQQQPLPASTHTSSPPLKVASQAGLGPVVVTPGGPRMAQVQQQQGQQQRFAAAMQAAAVGGMAMYEASLLGDRNLYNRSRSPPPAHQNSPSPQGEGIAHYQSGTIPMRPSSAYKCQPPSSMLYPPYIRQPYHISRSPGLVQEGEEAPDSMPPLELRRPGSVGIALTGRSQIVPPHSLQSPHDRTTDSPQIGQIYSPQLPLPHPAARMHPTTTHAPPTSSYQPRFLYDQQQSSSLPSPHLHQQQIRQSAQTPPPAHLHRQQQPLALVPPPTHVPDRPLSAAQMVGSSVGEQQQQQQQLHMGVSAMGAAGNLVGAVARHVGLDNGGRGLQVATPPYASQVPPVGGQGTTESLLMLLKQLSCMWQGLLALKNSQAAVQMYFISGNNQVAAMSLPKNGDGSTPPLRIFQRMRLEPMQVEGVTRKMQMEQEYCMLLALPCGHDHMDVLKQSENLKEGFITYLQSKQAAGIINVAAPGTTYPPAYVVHIFPSCDFVNESLRRIAPNLLERIADTAHLLIVITTV